MTAGTLATIAVDPSTDREAASLAIRRAAIEGGLGWLAAARLATAAMELVGAAPAVVELVTLTAADGARLGVAVTGGTGSCAALPAGLVDTCTERVRPTGELERVVAVSANPAAPDPAQAALCEALAGGLTTGHLLGHALATVERQAHALAVTDADELQAANQRVADLVAMLSHDIRQPLSVVTSYCTLLLDGWNDLAHTELRELLRRIVAAGTGMTQLVEEILTLTQLDTEGLGTRPAAVDAHAAVVDATGAAVTGGSVRRPRLRSGARPRHDAVGTADRHDRAPAGFPVVAGDRAARHRDRRGLGAPRRWHRCRGRAVGGRQRQRHSGGGQRWAGGQPRRQRLQRPHRTPSRLGGRHR